MEKQLRSGEPALPFNNREEVEAWLQTQPREVAIAVGARAALRVSPLAVSAPNNLVNLTSAIFRANALALGAEQYTTRVSLAGPASLAGASADAAMFSVAAGGQPPTPRTLPLRRVPEALTRPSRTMPPPMLRRPLHTLPMPWTPVMTPRRLGPQCRKMQLLSRRRIGPRTGQSKVVAEKTAVSVGEGMGRPKGEFAS